MSLRNPGLANKPIVDLRALFERMCTDTTFIPVFHTAQKIETDLTQLLKYRAILSLRQLGLDSIEEEPNPARAATRIAGDDDYVFLSGIGPVSNWPLPGFVFNATDILKIKGVKIRARDLGAAYYAFIYDYAIAHRYTNEPGYGFLYGKIPPAHLRTIKSGLREIAEKADVKKAAARKILKEAKHAVCEGGEFTGSEVYRAAKFMEIMVPKRIPLKYVEAYFNGQGLR